MAQERGTNIEALREINKIKFYRYDTQHPASTKEKLNEGKSTLLFDAYSKEPVGTFEANCETTSLTENWINGFLQGSGEGGLMHILTNSVVSKISQQAFGVSTSALQYDYNYMFKGTTSFSKNFNCYLHVVDDVYEDVVLKLYNLIKFVLPDELNELSSTSFIKLVDNEINKFAEHGDSNNPIQTIVNVGKDIAGSLWSHAKFYFGGATVMLAPPQLDPRTALKVCIGDYIVIENVIIDKVTFTLPFLTYEGGLFDHVDLSISLKGTRNMTIRTYDWLKKMLLTLNGIDSSRADAMMETRDWNRLTLNERFSFNRNIIKR